jgi:MbtH protein
MAMSSSDALRDGTPVCRRVGVGNDGQTATATDNSVGRQEVGIQHVKATRLTSKALTDRTVDGMLRHLHLLYSERCCMSDEDDIDLGRTYTVVVNDEEQYSIWWVDREIPPGWFDVGKSGSKEECLAYIDEMWTDMRPLSLRKKMAEMDGTAEG